MSKYRANYHVAVVIEAKNMTEAEEQAIKIQRKMEKFAQFVNLDCIEFGVPDYEGGGDAEEAVT